MPGIELPGVYAIAITSTNIAGRLFSWRRDVAYVGMTVAVSGLKGRLRAFDYTISGKRLAHGGADRVLYKYRNYNKLCPELFLAVAPTKCYPASNLPRDLKKMGQIARFEYLCFAEFALRYGRLPEFNKQDSPKHSLPGTRR